MTRLAPLLVAFLAAVPAFAEVRSLTFDASNVGGPNSGAAAELWRPADPGSHPAVVLLHGCGGYHSDMQPWAPRLNSWGYTALVVDSLGPRRIKSLCLVGGEPTPITRAQDAYNAATYLRSLPDILPDRIGVIGFSHGGSTVLRTTESARVKSNPTARPFQAAVAYYPGCNLNPTYGVAATDLLILIGKDDDWASAAKCEKFVADNKASEHAPRIKVYPGAVHDFDRGGSLRWTGDHSVGGNPEAAEDSFKTTRSFLDEHLKAR